MGAEQSAPASNTAAPPAATAAPPPPEPPAASPSKSSLGDSNADTEDHGQGWKQGSGLRRASDSSLQRIAGASPINQLSLGMIASQDSFKGHNTYKSSPSGSPGKGSEAQTQEQEGGGREKRRSDVFPRDAYVDTPKYSLFLGKQVKEVYFVRHAEGLHNAAASEKGLDILLMKNSGKKFWDSPLTSKGKNQCKILNQQLDLAGPPELVVVSPMTRAIQTAEIVFGPSSSVKTPPFLCREECRERFGLYTCDGRGPLSDLKVKYPDIDFSEVENENDELWTEELREPPELCEARGLRFLDWLSERPEGRIAVVTHSSFLRHLFRQFGNSLRAENQEELRRVYGNCELRTVLLCAH